MNALSRNDLSGSPLPKKSKYLKELCLVLAGTLLPIILFELWVYVALGYRMPQHLQEVFRTDPITGWAKVPNTEGYVYLYSDGTKQYIRNNSHGFTDLEREIKKVPTSNRPHWGFDHRILGNRRKKTADSFLMEQKLNHKWEVLNLGVRGFGTDQAYLLLKHEGIKYSPDIVIYTFCINDITDNMKTDKPHYRFESESIRNLVLLDYPYFPKTKVHEETSGFGI